MRNELDRLVLREMTIFIFGRNISTAVVKHAERNVMNRLWQDSLRKLHLHYRIGRIDCENIPLTRTCH